MPDGIEKQKEHLERVALLTESPIYTARNWRNNDKFDPGKQFFLGKLMPPVDHRSIGNNEVVIELDAKSFASNAKYAALIKDYLVSQHIPSYFYWSGNKSVHIHIYLDIDIKTKEGVQKIKDAVKHGCNIWKETRLKFAREICEQSGIKKDMIGIGKLVDLAKLSWNDDNTHAPLIRSCGGANKKVDEFGVVTTAYKMFLQIIPPTKPRQDKHWDFEDVEYEPLLEAYKIDEAFVTSIAESYMKIIENPTIKKTLENITYSGRYGELPCMKTLLEGLPAGKRSFGARQLSVALKLDGKSKKEAEVILKQYVANCTQTPEPFNEDEAIAWLEWAWKLKEPYWSCGNCVNLGICEKEQCPYDKEKFKEELGFFNVENPLGLVKRALDKLIIGEDHLKLQLFLIYLTRYLNPDWCIIIDGPASSGKSFTMKSVASLIGEENKDYFIYSRLTGKVLDRLGEEAKMWENAIVIIEEFQGAEAAQEQLRVLISERQLSLLETKEVKNPDGTKGFQKNNTVIKLKNTLFTTCQAETEDEGDQLRTRAWILNTDQSAKQTEDIVRHRINQFGGQGLKPKDIELIEKIRSAMRVLNQPEKVEFPFMDELMEMIKTSAGNDVRLRRDINKIIAIISASAIFHQNQRRWVGKTLIADWRDVRVIYEIAWDTLVATTQGLGEADMRHYYKIKPMLSVSALSEFSLQDAARWLGGSLSLAKKTMANLIRAGIYINKSRTGMPAVYEATGFEPKANSARPDFETLIVEQDKILDELYSKGGDK